jgi:hypothetical protein
MIRTTLSAAAILGFTTAIAAGEDAQQLTCTGMMIEPTALAQSPKTVKLTIGPGQKVAYDLGEGSKNARFVSDNKIQLKFRVNEYVGEYFHYTGDLFVIYKSGHLMRMACKKAEG